MGFYGGPQFTALTWEKYGGTRFATRAPYGSSFARCASNRCAKYPTALGMAGLASVLAPPGNLTSVVLPDDPFSSPQSAKELTNASDTLAEVTFHQSFRMTSPLSCRHSTVTSPWPSLSWSAYLLVMAVGL
ncbi:transglycosylase family protein [Streptomyces noursei]|uniref:transglycosylase family protein n=1 Tax=Streptomyces noursei TaxID=1971 RepID=UPI000C9AA824